MTAFVFSETPTFRAKVTVHMPTDKGIETFEFEGHFLMDGDVELSEPGAADDFASPREFNLESCRRIFKGWTEGTVMTPSGASLPCTPENIDRLIEMTPVRLAIFDAYHSATLGDAYRLGNSELSRAPSGNRAARRKAASSRP